MHFFIYAGASLQNTFPPHNHTIYSVPPGMGPLWQVELTYKWYLFIDILILMLYKKIICIRKYFNNWKGKILIFQKGLNPVIFYLAWVGSLRIFPPRGQPLRRIMWISGVYIGKKSHAYMRSLKNNVLILFFKGNLQSKRVKGKVRNEMVAERDVGLHEERASIAT